jgi:fumarate hydratase class II
MYSSSTNTSTTRTETDKYGPIEVSITSYYGADTAGSFKKFNIGLP